jgi:hypothetical protein
MVPASIHELSRRVVFSETQLLIPRDFLDTHRFHRHCAFGEVRIPLNAHLQELLQQSTSC